MNLRSLVGVVALLASLPAHAVIGIGAPATGGADLFELQPLKPEQRLSELDGIVRSIEEYYAPLEYKEKRFGKSWADHVSEYRLLAAQPMANDQFDDLLLKFMAWTKDAHVSARRAFGADGRRPVLALSTLGFLMEPVAATGESIVTKTLPLVLPATHPLVPQKGDVVESIDGLTVADYLRTQVAPYRAYGNDETDRSLGHLWATLRLASGFPAPSGEATVVLKRGDERVTARLPWVAISAKEMAELRKNLKDDDAHVRYVDPQGRAFHDARDPAGFLMQAADLANAAEAIALLSDSSDRASAPLPNPVDLGGDSAPLYSLHKTQSGLAAYLKIETFAGSDLFSKMACGSASSATVGPITLTIRECSDALYQKNMGQMFRTFEALGVKDIVVDLRGNGGGYLSEGALLAKAFAKQTSPMPLFSLRLNQEWVARIDQLAETARPLAVRERYRTMAKQLDADLTAGKRLSRPVDLLGLGQLPAFSGAFKGRQVFLIDERCASMCDLFASMMDGQPDTLLVGTQTLGAGGSVDALPSSPLRKLDLMATFSMATHPRTGEYLENNGIKPNRAYQRTRTDVLGDNADFRKFLSNLLADTLDGPH